MSSCGTEGCEVFITRSWDETHALPSHQCSSFCPACGALVPLKNMELHLLGRAVNRAHDVRDEKEENTSLSSSPLLCINTRLCPHGCSPSIFRKTDLDQHLLVCPNLSDRGHDEKCEELQPRHQPTQQARSTVDPVYSALLDELRQKRQKEREWEAKLKGVINELKEEAQRERRGAEDLQIKVIELQESVAQLRQELDVAVNKSEQLRHDLEQEREWHADTVRKMREHKRVVQAARESYSALVEAYVDICGEDEGKVQSDEQWSRKRNREQVSDEEDDAEEDNEEQADAEEQGAQNDQDQGKRGAVHDDPLPPFLLKSPISSLPHLSPHSRISTLPTAGVADDDDDNFIYE